MDDWNAFFERPKFDEPKEVDFRDFMDNLSKQKDIANIELLSNESGRFYIVTHRKEIPPVLPDRLKNYVAVFDSKRLIHSMAYVTTYKWLKMPYD